MTNHQPESAVPEADISSASVAPFSVGTALREARVHLGMSVDEISHRIKFAPRQIEALEADDFAHLPEAAFLRGFVRSYARLLQLDPIPLVAALPHAPVEPVPQEVKAIIEVPFPTADAERKQNIIWLAGAVVAVMAMALVAWLLGGKPKEQSATEAAPPQVQSASAVPVSSVQNTAVETLTPPQALPVSAVPETKMKQVVTASPPQTPASDAARQADIRLVFDGDSWAEIADKKGNSLLSQLNRAGSERAINGAPPFYLVIGNAKAVHLFYKGQAVDLAPYINIEVARLKLE